MFNTTEHLEEALQLVGYLLTTDYVMSFVNSGLWQPTTEEWYTDEALIGEWITEGVHPAHYREAVIDYTMNFMEPTSYFKVGCYSQINNLFLPSMDTALLGTSTAQESVDAVIEECRKVYSDYLASLS